MPIYEYVCRPCEKVTEAIVAYAKMREATPPCSRCGAPTHYAGLSTPTPGREQRFGLILNDGTKVRGALKGG